MNEGRDRGVPGEGKGRRDEVGHSGIWPASGPPPPSGETPLVGQGELTGEPIDLKGVEPAGSSEFETDPVCGSRVNVAGGERSEFGGHAYFFDSIDCRLRFEEAPDRFATLPDRRAP
jgi:YHS domain-containing protein